MLPRNPTPFSSPCPLSFLRELFHTFSFFILTSRAFSHNPVSSAEKTEAIRRELPEAPIPHVPAHLYQWLNFLPSIWQLWTNCVLLLPKTNPSSWALELILLFYRSHRSNNSPPPLSCIFFNFPPSHSSSLLWLSVCEGEWGGDRWKGKDPGHLKTKNDGIIDLSSPYKSTTDF